jgi:hypothetical protein
VAVINEKGPLVRGVQTVKTVSSVIRLFRVQCYITFLSVIYKFYNKLECLFLESFYSIVLQTSELSTKICKLRTKKFYNMGPRVSF